MTKIQDKIYETYSSKKVHKDGKIVSQSDMSIWARHTFERVKYFLPADNSAAILDIATGTGNFLFMLSEKGYSNLTGVDISEEQIDIAKRIVPTAQLHHTDLIDFLLGKENQFDLISGFDIIEHFTREEAYKLLLKVNKALKPNGRIILQTPNAYSPWMGSVCYGDLTHEWFYTPNSLDDLLIQCGFSQYIAIEAAPVKIGIKGHIRTLAWNISKSFYKFMNASEIGGSGKDQIFSRVFIAAAVKKI